MMTCSSDLHMMGGSINSRPFNFGVLTIQGHTTKNHRYILPPQLQWILAKEIVIRPHGPITSHLLIPWITQMLSFLVCWVIDYDRRMTGLNTGILHGTWPGDSSLIHPLDPHVYLHVRCVAQMPSARVQIHPRYTPNTQFSIVIESDLYVSKLHRMLYMCYKLKPLDTSIY